MRKYSRYFHSWNENIVINEQVGVQRRRFHYWNSLRLIFQPLKFRFIQGSISAIFKFLKISNAYFSSDHIDLLHSIYYFYQYFFILFLPYLLKEYKC